MVVLTMKMRGLTTLVGAAALVLMLGSTVLPADGAGAADHGLEAAVKATYIYKFGPFVEWPSSAFETQESPVSLCVVGNDPFGDILDQAVDGQYIGSHPIVVRRMHIVTGQSGCHILYAAGSRAQSVSEALEAVHYLPVLTVTNSVRNPEAKGIVHFVIEDNRVRFEIDDYTASENGLVISSKVLNLAVAVRSRV